MKNFRIMYHLMPWEIDYALLTFTTLKKASYHIPQDVNVSINSVLNLSSELIDWENSKLPKEYFIEKYNNLSVLLEEYQHTPKVYEGSRNYGHLDLQRDSISEEVDYYICVCPDQHFSEYLLSYLIQAVEVVQNKYFVITPQISKMWDSSWDVLTHPHFKNISYSEWDTAVDIYDVHNYQVSVDREVAVVPVNQPKWAGWFDLYNKLAFEELFEIPEEWEGYGGWDYYGITIASNALMLGKDFQQYCLSGEIAFEYSIGSLKTDKVDGFSKYYKKFLDRKDPLIKLGEFNSNLPFYINQQINKLNTNK
jgi:hypothetical protein